MLRKYFFVPLVFMLLFCMAPMICAQVMQQGQHSTRRTGNGADSDGGTQQQKQPFNLSKIVNLLKQDDAAADQEIAPGRPEDMSAPMDSLDSYLSAQSQQQTTNSWNNAADSTYPNAQPRSYQGLNPGHSYDFFGSDLVCNPEPTRLFARGCRGWQLSGWLQGGYHNNSDGLLNTNPGDLNLHQGWVTIDRTPVNVCGWDWGFRLDGVYGTDAYILQSFGNNPGNFDFQNGLDHGPYAWAVPQLFGELRYNAFGLRAGHFLSEFNYESIRSPLNFFYSRSYASILAAPISMTGLVGTYDDGLNSVAAGYVTGWDTGFDRFDGGAAFYGRYARRVTETAEIAFNTSFGNFGRRGDGYAHSLIYDQSIGCRWNYVIETTYLAAETGGINNYNFGVNQYLFYRWSKRIDLGQRLEWWKSDLNGAGARSTYAYTTGLNYRASSNVVIRPEIRYNWGEQFQNADLRSANFGIDAVIQF
ncbi:MAG TPA: outer membrane beta-barrel protein [Pirellulaceae bacterium]|nr:outer membrane beta-barrel protein [Pirellulaceae bacterium]HMO93697.1 outer membrane beta-barrel protein [Pirellulaceae bacterium]HMP71270.1 outer membrane beta-barrel protein [Pirellulaceae bacterium]